MGAINRPLIGVAEITAYFLEKAETEVTLAEERRMRGFLRGGHVPYKKMGKLIVSTTAGIDAVKAGIGGSNAEAA